MDGGERGGKRVYGTPVLCSQEGETDLAGREADVWVRNACFEADCGRGERVVARDFDVELPQAAC